MENSPEFKGTPEQEAALAKVIEEHKSVPGCLMRVM